MIFEFENPFRAMLKVTRQHCFRGVLSSVASTSLVALFSAIPLVSCFLYPSYLLFAVTGFNSCVSKQTLSNYGFLKVAVFMMSLTIFPMFKACIRTVAGQLKIKRDLYARIWTKSYSSGRKMKLGIRAIKCVQLIIYPTNFYFRS